MEENKKMETAGMFEGVSNQFSNALSSLKTKHKNEKRQLRAKFKNEIESAKEKTISGIKEYILSYFVNEDDDELNWEILFERYEGTKIVLKSEFKDFIKRESKSMVRDDMIDDITNLELEFYSIEELQKLNDYDLEKLYVDTMWAAVALEVINLRNPSYDEISSEEKNKLFEVIGIKYVEDESKAHNFNEWEKSYVEYVLKKSEEIEVVIAVSENADVEYNEMIHTYDSYGGASIYGIPEFIEIKLKEYKIWRWDQDIILAKEHDINAEWTPIDWDRLYDILNDYCSDKWNNLSKEIDGDGYDVWIDEDGTRYESELEFLRKALFWKVSCLKYMDTEKIVDKLQKDFGYTEKFISQDEMKLR